MVEKAWQQAFEAAGHMAPNVRKQRRRLSALSKLSPFYATQKPSPWNGIIHTEGGHSHINDPNLKNPSQMPPEVHCLLYLH